MRELKFRAKALDGGLICFELHESRLSGDSDVFYVGDIPCKTGTEQEYIGLKDKNGKEVYEGDVTCRHWDDGTSQNGKIIFDEAGFFWQEIGGNEKHRIGFIHPIGINTKHSEVIGNIMENPELLSEVN